MKTIIATIALALLSISVYAQNRPLPNTQPGAVNLPTPKIPAIKPADLEIASIQLVNAAVNQSTKLATITVRLTIKNNGQATASASNLIAKIQNISGRSEEWIVLGSPIIAPSIQGGQTLQQEFRFQENPRIISTASIHFKVLINTNKTVKESNTLNNESQGILIGL